MAAISQSALNLDEMRSVDMRSDEIGCGESCEHFSMRVSSMRVCRAAKRCVHIVVWLSITDQPLRLDVTRLYAVVVVARRRLGLVPRRLI